MRIFLLSVFVTLLVSCNSSLARTSEESSEAQSDYPGVIFQNVEELRLINYDTDREYIRERREGFEDALSMNASIIDTVIGQGEIGGEHIRIHVFVVFKNNSNRPLTIVNPTEISPFGWYGNSRTNITVNIFRSDGSSVDFKVKLHVTYSHPPLGSSEADFIMLDKGESLYRNYSVGFSLNDEDKDLSSEFLPPGIYTMTFTYTNHAVGYNFDTDQWNPPPDFDESILDLSTRYTVDINAWVGMLESNSVEFEVPEWSGNYSEE